MMRYTLMILLGMLQVATWGCRVRAHTVPDVRQLAFSSSVMRCDGQSILGSPWTAPFALTLRRIDGWIGTDGANPGTNNQFPPVDVSLAVYTSDSRWPSLFVLILDHYVPFTGRSDKAVVFPDEAAPRMSQGQQINYGLNCSEISPLISHAQAVVTVTYTVGW